LLFCTRVTLDKFQQSTSFAFRVKKFNELSLYVFSSIVWSHVWNPESTNILCWCAYIVRQILSRCWLTKVKSIFKEQIARVVIVDIIVEDWLASISCFHCDAVASLCWVSSRSERCFNDAKLKRTTQNYDVDLI
jgi:hypothetical protein